MGRKLIRKNAKITVYFVKKSNEAGFGRFNFQEHMVSSLNLSPPLFSIVSLLPYLNGVILSKQLLYPPPQHKVERGGILKSLCLFVCLSGHLAVCHFVHASSPKLLNQCFWNFVGNFSTTCSTTIMYFGFDLALTLTFSD